MTRPVVLHGSERALLARLGRGVASRLGLGYREIWEEGGLDKVGMEAPPSVTVCRSDLVMDRVARVELLARATVVAVEPVEGLLRSLCRSEAEEKGWTVRLGGLLESELAEAHRFVRTRDASEERIIEGVVELALRAPVVVAAGERTYLVEVGKRIVEQGVLGMSYSAATMLYLTDENVHRLHGGRLTSAVEGTGLRVVPHVLEPGEESKCLATLGAIFDVALSNGIDRSSWLVAAGGGVTTDIGGLVAALWMRGVKWLAIPTTLLAMVDASVGGKTAVDHGAGKNAVGAFWQPSRVICDVEFLTTESERNYVGALSEVVKTALIGDEALFSLLEEQADRVLRRDLDLMSEVVRRCVQVKARIVGLDERESGLRAVLNFGHTIGHALEALGEYKRYTHGEAVSLGMAAAVRLGMLLGYTPKGCAERLMALLNRLNLPTGLDRDELRASADLLGHDKKRAGSSLRFVFARGVGQVVTERIGLEDVRQLVATLA